MYVFLLGNFRNMPLTIAERYQLQAFAANKLTLPTNTDYVKVDHVLCINIINDNPVFGKVTANNTNTISVMKLDSQYTYHMHSYEINRETADNGSEELVATNLRYQQPISVFTDIEGCRYVCPRHVLYWRFHLPSLIR